METSELKKICTDDGTYLPEHAEIKDPITYAVLSAEQCESENAPDRLKIMAAEAKEASEAKKLESNIVLKTREQIESEARLHALQLRFKIGNLIPLNGCWFEVANISDKGVFLSLNSYTKAELKGMQANQKKRNK